MARKKTRGIYAVDIETDPFKYGRTPKPFAIGLYNSDEYVQFWGEDCIEQFLDYVQDIQDAIFYAHNGGKFDWFYFLKEMDADIFLINGRISKATINAGQIELRDSFLILPAPLKESGEKKDIEIWKLEAEHREEHKHEILSYLYHDCRALFNWVTGFIKNFGLHLTLAGAAFSELKKTSYRVENTSEQFDAMMREFYHGGRVQCFEVGAFTIPLKYYDIKSAYPFAMLARHWFGGGYRETFKLPDIENGSWFAKIHARSHGALPFKYLDEKTGAKKLYFPDDGKTRVYMASGWEIQAGLDTNTLFIDKVERVWRPNMLENFEEYVYRFYKMKLEAEENGDLLARFFAKLFLNSCYGKFGQDGRDFEKFVLCDFGDVPEPYLKKMRDEIKEEKWNEYGQVHYKNFTVSKKHGGLLVPYQYHSDTECLKSIFSRPDPSPWFYNVATAASVTGYVRAYLWRHICSATRPIYCDTDSLICAAFKGVEGKALGNWECEANITEAYIAQRKMYALKTDKLDKHGAPVLKVASKGVKLNFDQIKSGVLTGATLECQKEAPSFSLKFGSRFMKPKKINFSNIQKNACNNPPEKIESIPA